MRRLLPLLALALSACVSERMVAPDEAGTRSASLQMMNDPVTIVAAGRGTYRGRSVRIYPDSTTWIDLETGAYYGVPTREVERIERVSARKGAIRGVAIATIVAGVATTLLVYNLSQSAECAGTSCGPGAGLLLGLYAGTTAASLGVVPGILIGGAIGETDVVVFEAAPTDRAPLEEAVSGGTLLPVPVEAAPRPGAAMAPRPKGGT